MKAILVIDMPKDCWSCPFEMNQRCFTNTRMIEHMSEKPSWCPLRPLPKKKNTDKVERFGNSKIMWTDKTIYQNEGWNECLDEIKGETE